LYYSRFDKRPAFSLRGGSDKKSEKGYGNIATVEMNHPEASQLGGGAVNEKKRLFNKATTLNTEALDKGFNPSESRAHLYHALEGLDRYPNYLARWNVNDMDRLEQSLEDQLARVREQRAQLTSQRCGIQTILRQLNEDWDDVLEPPSTWDDLKERVFDAAFVQAIEQSTLFKKGHLALQQVTLGEIDVTIDPSALAVLMDEEMFDVYSFPLLQPDFCKRICDYVRHLAILGQQERYQSLNLGQRPFDLDSIGLTWLADWLFQLVVRPISRQLFKASECGGGELDWRHAFVAGYSATPALGKPRERLVTHTDDSEVTLNLCLGDDFEGGELEFFGLRGTKQQGQLVGTFAPMPGLALLHAGRHFHDVSQITEGDRFALIVWSRSWSGVRSRTCSCCWLNRRSDGSCVCGCEWN
jgi:hypothetical protein